jgi:mannose-6-phosphate isomerase-like protein (cupin superfamily)
MSTVTTGRTLDDHGNPVAGTGFELDPDGWLAEQVRERTGPITSHPTRPVWGIPLESSGDTIRTLSVFGPGYSGPPEHYHEQSPERFNVERGSLTMTLDGTDSEVTAGETATVETGVAHTFENRTDERTVVTTQIHSPGRLRQVLPTLGGLAHDDDRNAENPLQQALIADRLDGNTVFTRQERLEPLSNLLTPVAELAGYQGAYAKYTQPVFWEHHVEQPDL